MMGILEVLVVAGTLVTSGDTLIEVRQGDRLVLQDFSGTVHIESWDRSNVSLKASSEESVVFSVDRQGSRLEVRVEDGKSRNRAEELRIVLPPWMNLEMSGRELEADLRGLEGTVEIQNLRGDISLWDLAGEVQASTSQGSIDASNLSGTARLRSGDDDIWVGNSSGALVVETVAGEIDLEGIRSSRVSARTTDGEITFTGRLESGGDFGFHSHSGDIELHLLPPVNLDVSVLAYDGRFESDFPVHARGFRSGEGLEFKLGEGGGRLVLEAFDGTIRLLASSPDDPGIERITNRTASR